MNAALVPRNVFAAAGVNRGACSRLVGQSGGAFSRPLLFVFSVVVFVFLFFSIGRNDKRAAAKENCGSLGTANWSTERNKEETFSWLVGIECNVVRSGLFTCKRATLCPAGRPVT